MNEELKKEFWKITELKRLLEISPDDETITLSERSYAENLIQNLELVQKFGIEQGIQEERDSCLNIINDWLKEHNYYYHDDDYSFSCGDIEELKSRIEGK
jgi:hypothetical protein